MTYRTLALTVAAVLITGPLTACSDEDLNGQTLQCPSDPGPFTRDDSRVTGTAELAELPSAPLGVGDSVVVRGTAHHEDGLAIREVLVAGVSATSSVFNFKRWSVTLPYEALVLAAPVNGEGQVVVDAVAIDACGNRYPFLQITLPIDPTPGVDIEDLSLAVTYPGERSYLPADQSAAATLVVTATGRAAGAEVTFAATTGGFQGLTAASTLRLLSDGQGHATGTALFYADEPGTAVITALADATLASALVVAAEPPSLAPRRATLVPGAALTLSVLTEGELDYCQASPSERVTVRHGGVEIGAAAAAMTRDDAGDYLIELSADPEATAGETLTISCVDEYGQAGSGRFDLVVTDPPPAIVVDTLSLDLAIPFGRDHLPADASTAAVITVVGHGEAQGAQVHLSASSGLLQGAPDGIVTLAGAGESASATALYYPDTPGTVILTARTEGAVATATLKVVDAPLIAPASATLLPGQSLELAVISAGELASCQASPSANLLVETREGAPIGAAPTALPAGEGGATVVVSVPPDADDNATIELSCQDLWGQYGTAELSALVY